MTNKTNESWPKISIVTPSFNQAEFLEQTICSVLNQRYPNLEYIVIDGGSTDGSVDIIKRYQAHLTYWCSEPDEGQYHAIKKGFERSSGEIMAWINSDDTYCQWAFKTVGSIFRNVPECKWLTTLNALYWSEKGYCVNLRSSGGYSALAFADGENARFGSRRSGFIQQESTFWRRGLWDSVGGLDLSFKLAGDFDLWARFFTNTTLYGTIAPLAGFRIHRGNRSLDQKKYLEEVSVSLEKFRSSRHELNNAPRRLFKQFLNYIPLARGHMKVYSAKNIYRSTDSDDNGWIVRKVRF